MIRFEALMHAIQKSIYRASQAVESEGIKHVNKFFDKIPSSKQQDIDEHRDKLNEARDALNSKDIGKADTLIKELQSFSSRGALSPEETTIYRPKMIAMAFPTQNKDGVGSVIVNVPLITLCPVSSPRIKEVKFSTELEMTADDSDELYIAFLASEKNGADEVRKSTANTNIEVTLQGSEPPKGLQQVIEGYEKALRAQIPG